METTSKRRFTNICVFRGTSSGTKSKFVEGTRELGRAMANRNMHLVYGGGNLGLMGYISKAVQEGGSQVLGIIPKPLTESHIIGKSNGEECIVSGMSERLTEMINHTDVFIALPGGIGKMEEIFTVASWANLNIHQKPIGLFNVNGLFDFLFIYLEDAKRNEFISKSVRDIFLTARTTDDLIDQLLAYEPRIDPILSKLNLSGNDRGKKAQSKPGS